MGSFPHRGPYVNQMASRTFSDHVRLPDLQPSSPPPTATSLIPMHSHSFETNHVRLERQERVIDEILRNQNYQSPLLQGGLKQGVKWEEELLFLNISFSRLIMLTIRILQVKTQGRSFSNNKGKNYVSPAY